VRTRRDQQSLSYPLRVPDEMQAAALRVLDVSREGINLMVTALWGSTRRVCHAYQPVRVQTGGRDDGRPS
jgi:hypothetical protein